MFIRESTSDGKISYWTIKPEANRCLTLDQVYKVRIFSASKNHFTSKKAFSDLNFSFPMWPRLLSPNQPVIDPGAPAYPQTMQVCYQQVRLFLKKLLSVHTSSHCSQTVRIHDSSPSPTDHTRFIPGLEAGRKQEAHSCLHYSLSCVLINFLSILFTCSSG